MSDTSAPVILLARHYDRVSALLDGRVSSGLENARLEVVGSIPDTFRRMMNDSRVIAGEMSFGFQTIVASCQERSRFIAIPIFLSRSFRHGNVFVRKDSPLTDFGQLSGKRIALEEYAMTMAIWVRALFEDAGVAPESIHWITARDPVVVPEVEAALHSRLSLQRVEGESIWSLLERGKIDAAIGRPPDHRDVEGGAFRRLLPDHWERQRGFYGTTGIFPIMHVLVVRREAYEKEPQIALDLYQAFEWSKRLCVDDMLTNLNALTVTLPMLEAHIAETKATFGEDWWPYGIQKNRATLDAFSSHCFRQGLTPSRVKHEDIFCPNTLHL